MGRPLVVSDCDEVLLHMIAPFAAWLDEAHGLHFALEEADWPASLRERDGLAVDPVRAGELLEAFLEAELGRQSLVPGAVEALSALAEQADIVILTQIAPHHHARRTDQLRRLGLSHRLVCERGDKGPFVAQLADELGAGSIVFVDDRASQIESVARHAPQAWRLHMIAEPRVAAHMPRAPHAHARIDRWNEALPWIFERLAAA